MTPWLRARGLRPMGSPHPGHGKLVAPSCVRGIPDVLQVVALSLIMPPRMVRPRLTPLYASSVGRKRLHEAQSSVATGAHHQGPVTCTAPAALQPYGLTRANPFDVVAPEQQANHPVTIARARRCHRSGVFSTDNVTGRVPPKHDQIQVDNRTVVFEISRGHFPASHSRQTWPLPL